MKTVFTFFVLVLVDCAALSLNAQPPSFYQPTISTTTVVICKDTNMWRKPPYSPGGGHGFQFLMCKGVKVTYSDTLYYFHNDTFILMEGAEITVDSARAGSGRMFCAAPNSKIQINQGGGSVYCDSSVTVNISYPLQKSTWDTLSGGEYFDFSLWPGSKNPCCNAQTAGVREPVWHGDFVIAPNPSNGTIILLKGAIQFDNARVFVFDAQGRVVFRAEWNSWEVLEINTKLNSGVYSVLVQSGTKNSTQRLIVE